MKTITALAIACICCLSLFGQELKKYDNQIDLLFDKSEYIIEGKAVKWDSFIDSSNHKLYSVSNIEVVHIYRGSEKIGNKKIEIIVESGGVYIDSVSTILIPHNHIMPIAKSGIYYCVPSVYQIARKKTDDNIRINVLNSIRYNKSGHRFASTFGKGTDKVFKTKEEIYEFLRQHKNITFPEGSE